MLTELQKSQEVYQINNKLVHDAHDIDVAMPMYNLIEHSDNYSKTSWIL